MLDGTILGQVLKKNTHAWGYMGVNYQVLHFHYKDKLQFYSFFSLKPSYRYQRRRRNGYLMALNGNGVSISQPSLPIFKGENYDLWRIKMRFLLLSQEIWELVENG